MKHPGLVALGLYFLGLGGLLWWRGGGPREDGGAWVAGLALPRNQQLDSTDLVGPASRYLRARHPADSLLGRHLLVPKAHGEPVRAEEVSPVPVYQAGDSGSRIVVYRLEKEEYLAGVLRIGDRVVPCVVRPGAAGSDPVRTHCSHPPPFTVEAVHRPVEAGDDTWVALRVPPCHSGEIGEYLAREHRFLLLLPKSDP